MTKINADTVVLAAITGYSVSQVEQEIRAVRDMTPDRNRRHANSALDAGAPFTHDPA